MIGGARFETVFIPTNWRDQFERQKFEESRPHVAVRRATHREVGSGTLEGWEHWEAPTGERPVDGHNQQDAPGRRA